MTFNLILMAGALKPSRVFGAKAYSGTGSAQSITDVGISPDLTIILDRDLASNNPVQDTTQGTSLASFTNSSLVRQNRTQNITSFDSNGFTVGTNAEVNDVSCTYVSYSWKELPGSFDIVQYTGTGSATTFAHSLGVVPEMMIIKRVVGGGGEDWVVYHSGMDATPEDFHQELNQATVKANDATIWNDTAPSSSVFTVGTGTRVNASGGTYIAYLFASKASKSSVGSYTGDGNGTQAITGLGFSPSFVMIQGTDSGGELQWRVWDSDRGDNLSLDFQNASAETTNNLTLDADGFTVGYTAGNVNTNNYIFLAMG